MLVCEIFMSIQGESSYAGLPCVFVRLAGCNLSCSWCDTPYARVPGDAVELAPEEVMDGIRKFNCSLVEITGGEPMLQKDVAELMEMLLEEGYELLLETNGSVSLDGIDERVRKIVDVKCPTSGHAGSFMIENIGLLTPDDEVKFVIGSRGDYEFAKRFMGEFIRGRTEKILFAPVKPELAPALLADWILKDALNVRLQLQLHSYIWPNERGR